MIYFGIPTYKRAEKQRTLEYLESVGVLREQIVMSVQTLDDYTAYKRKGYQDRCGAFLYREAINLSDNANTILRYIGKGERILILDDDIKHISRLEAGKLKPITTKTEFEAFLQYGYKIATENRTIGFSVYPCHNAYFMSNTYNDAHIGEGTLLALTNTGILFDVDYDTKCDFDLTCRIIRQYGKYPRLNMFACNAPHYTKGGCEENWEDKARVAKDAQRLLLTYPELVRQNPKRQNEVLMRRIGRKIEV